MHASGRWLRGPALSACPALPSPPQHYTSDADGLCTRLIKPKVMEGTVAAQDEFFRSECCPRPQSSLASPPPPTQAPWHCPPPGGSGDLQGTRHTWSRLCLL